jgi:hypothetical protein
VSVDLIVSEPGGDPVHVTGSVADIIRWLLARRELMELPVGEPLRLTFHIRPGARTRAEISLFEELTPATARQ